MSESIASHHLLPSKARTVAISGPLAPFSAIAGRDHFWAVAGLCFDFEDKRDMAKLEFYDNLIASGEAILFAHRQNTILMRITDNSWVFLDLQDGEFSHALLMPTAANRRR